jgi:hypothetical protein
VTFRADNTNDEELEVYLQQKVRIPPLVVLGLWALANSTHQNTNPWKLPCNKDIVRITGFFPKEI